MHLILDHPDKASGLHWRAVLASGRPGGFIALLRAELDPPGGAAKSTVLVRNRTMHGAPRKGRPADPAADRKTACWRWEPDPSSHIGGRHIIDVWPGLRHVATGITDALPLRTAQVRYGHLVRQVLRHEAAHARFTSRDATLPKALRDAGVPFRIWNLLEDIRIEEVERRARGAFRWRRAIALPAYTADPLEWLYSRKVAEGLAIGWAGPVKTAVGDDARRVLSVTYINARDAVESKDLIPIAAEFLKHFPPPPSWPSSVPDPGDTAAGEADGKLPADDGKPGDKPDGKGTDGDAPTPAPGEKPAPAKEAEPTRETASRDCHGMGRKLIEWSPSTKVAREWTPERGEDPREYAPRVIPECWDKPLDVDLIRSLAARLARTVRLVADVPSRLGEEGRRVYVPSVAVGDPACWLRRAEAPGRPELVLIVDMSGSMMPLWMSGGRELILAWRHLALVGTIDLRVWLTGGTHACRLPLHAPDDVWRRLMPTKGVEAFPRTLELAREDLVWARLAVCYSDGDLTDGDIDLRVWRARGVDLVGTAICADMHAASFESNMRRNFGRVVLASSAPALASRLAVALSRRR